LKISRQLDAKCLQENVLKISGLYEIYRELSKCVEETGGHGGNH
jgi:hypothetical protein